jgi:hypothetical protein
MDHQKKRNPAAGGSDSGANSEPNKDNGDAATNSSPHSVAQAKDLGKLGNAALDYAKNGWPVFPCNPLDKRPLTKNGFKDATTDEKTIRAWWKKTQWPNAMIGVPMGMASGIFCVDLDRKKDGADGISSWVALTAANGGEPETRTHITPSTGQHKLFRHQTGIRNIPLDKLAPGIEVKGEGGYIIVPPSINADGKEYSGDDAEIVAAPAWLLDLIFAYLNRADGFDKEIDQDAGKGISHGAGYNFPPANPSKIRAALKVIPSDDYDLWYRVAGAIRRELGDAGYGVFEEWSRKSKKFDVKKCRRKWNDASDISRITAGTIYHLADEYDASWLERFEAEEARAAKSNVNTDDTITAEELMRITFPPVRYIVPGYIVEGLTVLGGKPKTGKSWLAYDVSIAVAVGGMAMGTIQCEQGDVLYLCLEDNRRRVQKRINVVRPYSDRLGGLQRLSIRTRAPRVGEGLSVELEKWRTQAANPRLIIIDVWLKVRPRRKRGEDLYAADYAAAEPLQQYAAQHGLGIVIITHARKSKAEAGDPLEEISGTNGITGAADSVLVLTRDADGSKLYGRGRDMADVETALAFDAGKWKILGTVQEVHISEQRKKIIAALEEAGKPLSPKEISDVTGLKYANVRQLLFKMGRDGEVTSNNGRYSPMIKATTPEQENLL